MSRPPTDPSEKLIEIYLTLSHGERQMMLKFLSAFAKNQARDVDPTDREAAIERKAAKKRATRPEEPTT